MRVGTVMAKALLVLAHGLQTTRDVNLTALRSINGSLSLGPAAEMQRLELDDPIHIAGDVTVTGLPGIGSAVVAAGAPKLFVPNTAGDPEQYGMSIEDALGELVRYVRRDAGEAVSIADIVNLVVLDRDDAHYAVPPDVARLRRMGVEVARVPLVTPRTAPRLESQRFAEMLLSLT